MSMSMYKFVFKLQDGEKLPRTPKAANLQNTDWSI